jgi:hypothetical protein
MNAKQANEPSRDAPLNPALHREVDATHGTEFKGTDPMKTVSVKNPDEGRSWPMIWAVVAIVCLAIAVYYVIT